MTSEIVLPAVFALAIAPSFAVTLVLILRQFVFTAGALLHPAREEPTPTGSAAPLPRVSVIVPAHNEERVIADALNALLASDYPRERFEIIVVNDRSSDDTRAIVDRIAANAPHLRAIHRDAKATPGKAAAIRDALDAASGEVLVFFDADYLPGRSLVRRLVAPLHDPAVGAVMGRVVPVNASANLLTRLTDLERRGGYAIDQRMRDKWGLLPQFGGTVGAVRVAALRDVGGFCSGHMTEDTHLTYSLFLAGWRVAYLNEAACYEEVPETWTARYRQVRRWSYGHNACLLTFLGPILRAHGRPRMQRLDAALVLLVYAAPVLSLFAMPFAIAAPAIVGAPPIVAALPLAAFLIAFGNLAPFFQIMAACRTDGQDEALAALPLLPVSSAIGMFAAADGAMRLLSDRLLRRRAVWDKTLRFRRPARATNGDGLLRQGAG